MGFIMRRRATLAAAAAWLIASGPAGIAPRAWACPLCGPPGMTLAEQVARRDCVLLMRWVSTQEPEDELDSGKTTFEYVARFKGTPEQKPGYRLTIDRMVKSKPGSLYLLNGSFDDAGKLQWGFPLAVSQATWDFITQAPVEDATTHEKIRYYAKFLEHSDPLVAGDAFVSFAAIEPGDIAACPEAFSREKLRSWLDNPETPIVRRSFYAMLLGLVGNDDDAAYLEKSLFDPPSEAAAGARRYGLEGLVVGLVLQRGANGFDAIDRLIESAPPIADSDAAAVAIGLRYLWTYGGDRVPRERLRLSMRKLLAYPRVAETAITDLARWKDWSVQKRLRELFETPDYNVRGTRQAIVQYMHACLRDAPAQGETPPHVADAKRYLAEMRALDAKLVEFVEKTLP